MILLQDCTTLKGETRCTVSSRALQHQFGQIPPHYFVRFSNNFSEAKRDKAGRGQRQFVNLHSLYCRIPH
jgi:hypothetical protein